MSAPTLVGRDDAVSVGWRLPALGRGHAHAVELLRGKGAQPEHERLAHRALCGANPTSGWSPWWVSTTDDVTPCDECERLYPLWHRIPTRDVDTKVYGIRDREEWHGEYDDDRVVEVIVDGHVVAEVIVREVRNRASQGEGTRPQVRIREVRHDEFPVDCSFLTARYVDNDGD